MRVGSGWGCGGCRGGRAPRRIVKVGPPAAGHDVCRACGKCGSDSSTALVLFVCFACLALLSLARFSNKVLSNREYGTRFQNRSAPVRSKSSMYAVSNPTNPTTLRMWDPSSSISKLAMRSDSFGYGMRKSAPQYQWVPSAYEPQLRAWFFIFNSTEDTRETTTTTTKEPGDYPLSRILLVSRYLGLPVLARQCM